MKNCFLTTLFSVLSLMAFAQYIPNTVYYLADYDQGNTDIYEIKFEDADANLYFISSVNAEVHIAYESNTHTIYAIDKTGNRFRTLDLNVSPPQFSNPIQLNEEMGSITAATFEHDGNLLVGSANQNKIYSINVSTLEVSLYDGYAPVEGGDMAFDLFGNLFLASHVPTGFFEINPATESVDQYLGGIPPWSTGLARFEQENLLFSEMGNSFLEERETEQGDLISQIDLYLNGDPFTLHWGDMASGYESEAMPGGSTDCEDKKTFYADYDGSSTGIYGVTVDENCQLYQIGTVNSEVHIASANGLIFAVYKDGSAINVLDGISLSTLGTVDLNLNGSHIVAATYHDNFLYIGDQTSNKIYTVDPFAATLEPVYFADAPLSGGDLCFYGSELFLANSNLAKLFKYNGTDFDEIGDLPPNVTGLATFSDYYGTIVPGQDMIVSCRGTQNFYSISPMDASVVDTFPAQLDEQAFSLHYGDMASYCSNLQVNMDVCAAEEVLEYTEGTTLTGGTISENRTNPNAALGVPDSSSYPNFVSLGYGGSIILATQGYIQNGPGADIEIVETSYNSGGCESYPEFADISLSQDGMNWVFIGTVCKSENQLDISDGTDLTDFRYIKIQNNDVLSSTEDGFDLNAVVTLHECLPIEESQVSTKIESELSTMKVYPNPSVGRTKISYLSGEKSNLQVDILNLDGRLVKSVFKGRADAKERITMPFDANAIPNGIYLIRATTQRNALIEKLVIAH